MGVSCSLLLLQGALGEVAQGDSSALQMVVYVGVCVSPILQLMDRALELMA